MAVKPEKICKYYRKCSNNFAADCKCGPETITCHHNEVLHEGDGALALVVRRTERNVEHLTLKQINDDCTPIPDHTRGVTFPSTEEGQC